jgi:hypothetical protein
VTLTTTPLIVAPQSIPRIGIYVSGAQNFLLSIANRLPRSEMGMVDPAIASKTAGNCPSHRRCRTVPGEWVSLPAGYPKWVVHLPCQKISVLIY